MDCRHSQQLFVGDCGTFFHVMDKGAKYNVLAFTYLHAGSFVMSVFELAEVFSLISTVNSNTGRLVFLELSNIKLVLVVHLKIHSEAVSQIVYKVACILFLINLEHTESFAQPTQVMTLIAVAIWPLVSALAMLHVVLPFAAINVTFIWSPED